jgi:secondary thiamine-phosphate synthase enzyme
MQKLTIKSNKKKEIVDITDLVNDLILKSSYDKGLCHLFITHTTCAITTADLDPGTDLDMLNAFDKIIPDLPFRHPHNPKHAPEHIMSSILGSSLTIPVQNSSLVLGTWQRVVVVELSGPKERYIALTFVRDKRKEL